VAPIIIGYSFNVYPQIVNGLLRNAMDKDENKSDNHALVFRLIGITVVFTMIIHLPYLLILSC